MPQPVYEPEDKVVAKVATLYGILEQLGFTNERVEECLKAVKVLELDDCMDWVRFSLSLLPCKALISLAKQLFLHCDVSELACEGPIAAIETEEHLPESIPPTPKAGNSPRQSLSAPSRLPPLDSAKSPPPASPNPRARTATANGASAPPIENGASDLRARILAYEEELDKKLSLSSGPSPSAAKGAVRGSFFSSGASDSGDSSEDESSTLPDSNAKYAQLKLQLSEIQRAQAAHKRATKGKGDRKGAQPLKKEEEEWMEAKAEVLKAKISKVEGEYTFRKVDAEKSYREERTKLDAAQLAARLSGATLESVVPGFPSANSSSNPSSAATPDASGLAPAAEITSSTSSSSPSATNGSSPSSPTKSSSATTDDPDASDLFGTLLDEPTAVEEEEKTEEGVVIPVRDMSLPNKTSKTPKTALEETVRKLDKYGTVVFSLLSRSRAVRSSVTIRWSGNTAGSTGEANGHANGNNGGGVGNATGRTQTWRMDDIACRDQAQANNYIATVALFAVASSKEGSGIQANKALPTVFRDLWDELVEKRKREDEESYRVKLKIWKALAEPRCQEQPVKVRFLAFLLSLFSTS
jgi:ATP-dependent RNA helicase DHX29